MRDLDFLQQLIETIEAGLEGPLNVETLADRAGYSRWHFQRLFAAATGQTPAGYIRARRLSEAARALRGSDTGILPLALKYGFESQAAFTRAFSQYFGLTPGAARNGQISLPLQEPLQIRRPGASSMSLQPEIIHEPARTVAGISTRFVSALSPQTNNLQAIPALWDRAIPKLRQIGSLKLSYGVIDCDHAADGELSYLAAVPINGEAPSDMEVRHLPGGLYARFIHDAPLSEIGQTMKRIYTEWLPDSGYQLDERPELELYDERFRPDLGQTVFEVMIPVRKADS